MRRDVPTLYAMGQNRSDSRIVLIDFLRGLCLPDHDSGPPAGNPHTKVHLAGFGFFLGALVLRVLVGAGCRPGLWPDRSQPCFSALRQCVLRRTVILYLANAG